MKTYDIEERKKDLYEYLEHLEEEIEILKGNIVEFKKMAENIQSDDEFNNLMEYDIEKGITLFELF